MSRRADLARALGYEVQELAPTVVEGVKRARYRVVCDNNIQAIELFDLWARDEGVNDWEIADLGARIKRAVDARPTHDDRRLMLAIEIQQFVQEHMRFQQEPGETSRSSSVTLALGAGDCDEAASLVCALDVAAGLDGHVRGIARSDGEIVHAVGSVTIDGREYWQEASVPARFGEHPRDAAKRMNIVSRQELLQ